MSPVAEQSGKVCVGVIAGAHGIKGAVKLNSFTANPEAIADYGDVTDANGKRSFSLEIIGKSGDALLAQIDGIEDRDAATALRGTKLYVSRDVLPEPEDEDEFYHTDLIGIMAIFDDGEKAGKINAIYNFGASDMLEINGVDGKVFLVPFTKVAVPVVDVKTGKVVVAKAVITDESETDNDAEN